MTETTTSEQLAEIEGQPQAEPVQVCDGRWRTRNGEIKNIRACEPLKGAYYVWPWTDGFMTFQDNGRHLGSQSVNDLVEYLGPIEQQPEPQPEPVPDADERIQLLKQANDSQAETIGRLLSEARDLNMEIGGLERQLSERDARIRDVETMHAAAAQAVVDAGKGNDKLRAQVEELRSEVANVQNLLGESRQRVTQLEELVGSLRTINEATEKTVRLAGQENTDLQHRLEVVSDQWAEQADTARKLQTQLEAVEAELVQERLERNRWQNQVLRLTTELEHQTTECRNLRIELDALQQAPQAETVAARPTSTEDRFEQGWDAGTSQAVETIAEWLEPFRTCGSQGLSHHVMQNLPHIMRTLTGLTPED